MSLYSWLQRHQRLKAFLRGKVATALRALPAPLAYRIRRAIEIVVYRSVPEVGDLPEIFHYWSNACLRPKLEAAGYASPDDFFFREVAALAADFAEARLHCVSIACGRCEMEIAMAVRLRDSGVTNATITAYDINERMLRDAHDAALAAGVGDFFRFEVSDLNTMTSAAGTADVVIANQCLHHFTDLESVLDFVQGILAEEGIFLTSDVIGRNGHMLWPEALEVVQRLWAELPRKYREDRALGTVSDRYVNYDHSNVGFEGIRAQDILGLLIERFDFEFVLAFACIILPFVERRFGRNFDPALQEDRDIIDRIARMDEELIERGTIKPTQLLAKMKRRGKGSALAAGANNLAAHAWRDPAAASVFG